MLNYELRACMKKPPQKVESHMEPGSTEKKEKHV